MVRSLPTYQYQIQQRHAFFRALFSSYVMLPVTVYRSASGIARHHMANVYICPARLSIAIYGQYYEFACYEVAKKCECTASYRLNEELA